MKTVWTKLALQDLQQVRRYIESDNPDAANSVIQKIAKAIESLQSYQNLGRPGRVKGTRELVVIGTPFLVPYRVKQERIEILAVIHGARRWPENF
ncbi:MAG: type II toxin-antitoxin system RelE/ParE family toxin [Deltaproteobacteria bacterium]|nr:type II toxin-antitoxin system RelE/ParE family toxin [Deltaproteobacteria bacterium]MBI4373757.1 type II toxin-antitoxin system RelE/ParE family toxin [Deltaproteobacteria bacterium]